VNLGIKATVSVVSRFSWGLLGCIRIASVHLRPRAIAIVYLPDEIQFPVELAAGLKK
jgi:hypothetical protein